MVADVYKANLTSGVAGDLMFLLLEEIRGTLGNVVGFGGCSKRQS
jgi:hypothetical protein